MTQNFRVWMQKKFWGRRYSTRWHFPQTIEDNQPFLILDLVCLLLSLWDSGRYLFLKSILHILIFSLVFAFQSLLVTWQKSFGLKMIDSDRFHADIGIASNFCNGVLIIKLHRPWLYGLIFKTSRIFWGLLFDRIGYKRSTITIAVCVCLGVTALPLLQFLGGLKDQTKSFPWFYFHQRRTV